MSHRKCHIKYHKILYHKILCFLYYSMTTKKKSVKTVKYEEGKVKIIKSYSRLWNIVQLWEREEGKKRGREGEKGREEIDIGGIEKWEIEQKKRKEKERRKEENRQEENRRKIEKEGERQIVYAQKLEKKIKKKCSYIVQIEIFVLIK